MVEHSKGLEYIKKIAWLGIENNVSNTLKLACAKLGVKMVVISPKRHEISVDEELNKMADYTGLIEYTTDLKSGLEGADYVHTDTWMDMEFFQNGQIKPEMAEEFENRKKIFAPYQLNASLVETYCPTARIMHCMPCHVGYEITSDAINHRNSVIFDQAENRMHAQKGIIMWLLEKENLVS
jgi:ornithine carbamoyltransferase